MNIDDRKEYVKYRIESAYRTFDAAKILAESGHWNSAVNRLYYALFYAFNSPLVAKIFLLNPIFRLKVSFLYTS